MSALVASEKIDYPYPGLRSFETEEAEIFFGREEHVDELLVRLQRNRFLAVVGPSGCGKSSLIRAGMIPALRCGLAAAAGTGWQMATMRPGFQPLKNLAHALRQSSGSVDDHGPSDAPHEEDGFLPTVLARGPLGLVEALAEYGFAGKNNLLLLVDQFEELFRVAPSDDSCETRAFVNLLLASAQSERFPVYVVLTLRSDFLGYCTAFRGLPEALNNSQYLTPRLNREQQRAAIEGPAALFNTEIRAEVVNRILNEMGVDPDQLPLMQYLLMRMWRQERLKTTNRDQRLELTMDTYRLVGGLHGCVSSHAEGIYKKLKNVGPRIAELLFRCLAEVTPDARIVRRPRRFDELCHIIAPQESSMERGALDNVIEAFRQEGVSFLMPPHKDELREDSLIDISHESVIRQWARLKDWVLDEYKISRIKKTVAEKAKQWKEKSEDKDYLLFGVDLAEAKVWRDKYPSQVETDEGRVITESIKHEQEDVRRDEAVKYAKILEVKNRWLWIWLVVAAICASLATILFCIALVNAERATGHEKDVKRKLAMTAEVRGMYSMESGDLAGSQIWFTRALELQREAQLQSDPDEERIHRIRMEACKQQQPQLAQMVKHEKMTSAALSLDQRWIVTTSQDGTFRIWDTTTREEVPLPSDHPIRKGKHPWMNWAAFSPDGKYLITGSGNPSRENEKPVSEHGNPDSERGRGIVQLWKTGTWEDKWTRRCAGAVIFVAFSPDGSRVVAAGEAKDDNRGEAHVWEVNTDQESLLELPHDKGMVNHAAFSPNSQSLVTASGQPGGNSGEAQVWDLVSRHRVLTRVVDGPVNHVEFSPSGRHIVMTDETRRGEAGQATILDIEDPQGKVLTMRHNGGVRWGSFSPDGSKLVTASEDGTAKIWDLPAGNLLHSLSHGGTVFSAAFSPEGRYIITASRDRSARVWDADAGEPVTPLLSDTQSISTASFSQDGFEVIAVSADTARLWQIANVNSKYYVLIHSHDDPAQYYEATRHNGHESSGSTLKDLHGQSTRSPSWVKQVACSTDGSRVLTVSGKSGESIERVCVWYTSDGECHFDSASEELTKLYNGLLSSAALSPDGSRVAIAFVGNDGKSAKVAIWDVDTKKSVGNLEQNGPIEFAGFSEKGEYLLMVGAGQDSTPGGLELWSSRTNNTIPLAPFHENTKCVNCLAFSPGPDITWVAVGTGLLANDTGRVEIWEAATGRKIDVLEHNAGEGGVLHIAFNPDGQRLISASADDSARVWEIPKNGGEVVQKSPKHGFRHTADVIYATFNPQCNSHPTTCNNVLTVGKDGAVVVWNLKNGEKQATFSHKSSPNYASFSPDGKLVVSASKDGAARLWRIADGSLVTILPHGCNVQYSVFNRMATQLVTVGARVRTVKMPGRQSQEMRLVQTRVWDLDLSDPKNEEPIEESYMYGQLLSAKVINREKENVVADEDVEKLFDTWQKYQKQVKPRLEIPIETRNRLANAAASECEAKGQWFAAAWQLTILIKRTPDEPDGAIIDKEKADLFRRRAEAYNHLDELRISSRDNYFGDNYYWRKVFDDYSEALTRAPEGWRRGLQDDRDIAEDKLRGYEKEVLKQTHRLNSNPDDPKARLKRADSYLKLKIWYEARQDYDVLLRDHTERRDWDLWFKRAQAFAGLGQWKEVIDDCDEALKLEKKDGRIWALRARGFSGLKKWKNALYFYDQSLKLEQNGIKATEERAQTYLDRGRTYAALHRSDEAIDDYLLAARGFADQPSPQLKKKAVEIYSEALQLRPNDPRLFRYRAKVYDQLKRYPEAREDYTKALRLLQSVYLPSLCTSAVSVLGSPFSPGSFEAVSLILAGTAKECAIRQGRAEVNATLLQWGLAAEDYTKAILQNPGDRQLWAARAAVYANWKKWGDAIADYSEALKLGPTDWQLLSGRAWAFASEGDWAKSAADYSLAVPMQPENFSLRYCYSQALTNLARWSDAIDNYKEMLKSQPNYTWLWLQSARAQAEAARWGDAETSLKKAGQLMQSVEHTIWLPPERAIWQSLALVLLKEEKTAEYRKYCSKLLQRFGPHEQAEIANTISWVCLLAPDAVSDPLLPVNLAQRAIASLPKSYSYRNTYGIALYRAGRFEDAIDALTKACDLFANDPPDNSINAVLPDGRGTALDGLFLAMAHHKLGHDAEAQSWLERSTRAIEQFTGKKFKDASDARLTWNRIELDIFRHEAESVLEQKN